MPGITAPNHQHLFCARLDMAVDGDANRLVEMNVVQPPMGDGNPNGNAFRVEPTVLETEGGRTRNADTERYWKVESASATNGMGRPTAYRLHSSGMLRPWLHPETKMAKRAAFIFNHVWCTPYSPAERFPAGRFVNQSDGVGDHRDLGEAGPVDLRHRYRAVAQLRPAPPAAATRTGRSSRWPAPASAWRPTASSTATRPWTCRRGREGARAPRTGSSLSSHSARSIASPPEHNHPPPSI